MNEPPKHVLLIEDNPGDADLIRLRLIESKTPVEVNRVECLSDGLTSLEHETPSVVLLDLNLPDSQGAETFRRVLAKAPEVPVVILSGQDDEGLAIKALHQGVQDYLVKSDFSHGELDRAVRHAVERQALLRSLEMSRKQQLEFKNQFLSHVSHELRTPLTCIHQFVTILLDGLAGTISEEQREHLQTILRSVNQLTAMVRDLLEATRAEAGKIKLETCCLSILDPMRAAGAMLQAAAREKRINLEVAAGSNMPFVLGDTDRILEVLINLIDNAIKYGKAGEESLVRVRVERSDRAVLIRVSDEGPGIARAERERIFERFVRGNAAKAGDGGMPIRGSGIGLALVRHIAESHGGTARVVDTPAKEGSTFELTIPVAHDETHETNLAIDGKSAQDIV